MEIFFFINVCTYIYTFVYCVYMYMCTCKYVLYYTYILYVHFNIYIHIHIFAGVGKLWSRTKSSPGLFLNSHELGIVFILLKDCKRDFLKKKKDEYTTETECGLQNLKYLLIWPFTEKIDNPILVHSLCPPIRWKLLEGRDFVLFIVISLAHRIVPGTI